MNRGFYTAIAGMNIQQARMELVSNNLSNINTAGYKRETSVISPFKQMMLLNLNTGSALRAQEIGTLNPGAEIERTVTDFTPGTPVQTGNKGDLALTGKGFFTLVGDNGERRYTRNGRFYVDSGGYITHGSGMRLLGNSGPLQVTGGEFNVSRNGTVTSAGKEAGKIAIGNFDNPGTLRKTGGGLFAPPDEATASNVENPEILQGFVETSNVKPATEMITSMEVLRAFGAGQKIVQAHDRLLELAVREVGRVK